MMHLEKQMFRIDFRVGPKCIYASLYPLPEEGGWPCSRHTILTFMLNSRRRTKSKKWMIRITITTLFCPNKLYLRKLSALFHIPFCWHDVVSVLTWLRGERSRVRLPAGARALFLTQNSRPTLQPAHPRTNGYPGVLHPDLKRLERETNLSS